MEVVDKGKENITLLNTLVFIPDYFPAKDFTYRNIPQNLLCGIVLRLQQEQQKQRIFKAFRPTGQPYL